MSDYPKIAPATYLIPRTGEMRVPGLLIASEPLLEDPSLEKPLEQLRNVAHLPGIVGHSIAMPDIHWGYGFPIGGVAAMDPESGVISPGGVGYDINCGVRLAVAPVMYKELDESKLEKLLNALYHTIPSGVGHGQRAPGLTNKEYEKIFTQGARWSVEEGFGVAADLDHCESHGCIAGADPDLVSQRAKERGKKQLGTVGSGNHFVEIGEVQQLIDSETAEQWGVQAGQLYIMIHSGSRGLGHQICQETLDTFLKAGFAKELPDRQLVCAPIKSKEGRRYFATMAAAANFAFNNRQQILHEVRHAFEKVLGITSIKLIYDVCHNIAKFETHDSQQLCVHRKGATRAFGPGHPELAPLFQPTGQPVLVPGDMGRASYLLVGRGNPLTWNSSCHGAGRARSRIKSHANWRDRDPFAYMESQGVRVAASSKRTVTEEMPDAYKDVDLVVEAVEEAQLANRVARLKPHLVLKG